MKKLQVYILEDEYITQEVLKNTLQSLHCNVCGVETNAERAYQEISNISPDFAILDIRVEGDKTGLWLGEKLNIPIIYLTAFSDTKNVKEAAKTSPVSYLQKPFNDKDLFIAIELVKAKLEEGKEIFVKEKNYDVKVKLEDVIYAKKEDHYLILFTLNSKKVMRATIQEFLNQATSDFIQVHRSYIVNKKFIKALSNKIIIVSNTQIPVSNSYIEAVKSAIF